MRGWRRLQTEPTALLSGTSRKNLDFMFVKIVDHLLPLPPKIFLNSGTEAADEVVEIHEHMNTHVQESYE